MNPMFSVIIPVYNREKQIGRCLESVLGQTFKNFEIIVVDDGSRDQTKMVVRSFGEQVCLIEQQNQGPAVARNTGLRAARGEYAAFLDSDDLWFDHSLATYSAVIKRYSRPSVICGEPLEFRGESPGLSISNGGTELYWYESVADFLKVGGPVCFYTPSLVVKREEIAKVGGFVCKKMNGEDIDLVLKLCTAPGFVQIKRPQSYAFFRGENNALSKNEDLNFLAIKHLMESEKQGWYPGGKEWSATRWSLILFMARSVSLRLAKASLLRKAWALYSETFFPHVLRARFKYVCFFPVLWLGFYVKQRVIPGRV